MRLMSSYGIAFRSNSNCHDFFAIPRLLRALRPGWGDTAQIKTKPPAGQAGGRF